MANAGQTVRKGANGEEQREYAGVLSKEANNSSGSLVSSNMLYLSPCLPLHRPKCIH